MGKNLALLAPLAVAPVHPIAGERHAPEAGRERDEGPYDRHAASDEHRHGPPLLEPGLGAFDVDHREADPAAPSGDGVVQALLADPRGDAVEHVGAHHRAGRRGQDHAEQVGVAVAGDEAGEGQHRLAGDGREDALDGDQQGDAEVAESLLQQGIELSINGSIRLGVGDMTSGAFRYRFHFGSWSFWLMMIEIEVAPPPGIGKALGILDAHIRAIERSGEIAPP